MSDDKKRTRFDALAEELCPPSDKPPRPQLTEKARQRLREVVDQYKNPRPVEPTSPYVIINGTPHQATEANLTSSSSYADYEIGKLTPRMTHAVRFRIVGTWNLEQLQFLVIVFPQPTRDPLVMKLRAVSTRSLWQSQGDSHTVVDAVQV